MAEGIWMGTLDGAMSKMQWVKAPQTGMGAGSQGFSETVGFVNGGSRTVTSVDAAKTFEMHWAGSDNDAILNFNIDEVLNYRAGEYGTGYIYVADPMNFTTNLFRKNWASPGLIEGYGYKNIARTYPGFGDTAANSYNQPGRTATFDITESVGAYYRAFTIPIPPTYTLRMGVSGASTGTGVVRVQPINTNGTLASVTDLTLLSITGATRLNATFSGATYKAVRVYLTRQSAVASTVSIASMMAQLWPTGVTPTLTGNHIRGQGVCGMLFSGDSIPYTYTMAPRHIRGFDATLIEDEEWFLT